MGSEMCIRDSILRMCRLNQLTQCHRAHTTPGWQSAPCLQRRARTFLQIPDRDGAPDSHPHSPHSLCGCCSAPAHSDMRRTADRRHSHVRPQSAHTSHNHPHRHPSAATAHQTDREDASQVGSSHMSSRPHCAARTRTDCTSNARHSPRCLRHIRCMCCRLRCRGSAQDPHTLCTCSHRSQQSAGSQRGTPSKPRRPHCKSQRTPGTPPAEHPAPRQRCTGCTCCHPCCIDQPGTPRSRQQPHSAADLGRTSRKMTSCPALGDRCCGDACRSGTQCSASHQH